MEYLWQIGQALVNGQNAVEYVLSYVAILFINSAKVFGAVKLAQCPASIVSTVVSTSAALRRAMYISHMLSGTELSCKHLMYVQGMP